MRRDLELIEFDAAQNWNETSVVTRTFGGVPTEIERWALAERFLDTWIDWSGLFQRWRRYFGVAEGQIPRSWFGVEERCAEFVNHLCKYPQLREVLRRELAGEDLFLKAPAATVLRSIGHVESPVDLVHEILDSDERLKISALLTSRDHPDKQLQMNAERLDQDALGNFEEAPADVAIAVLFHLRVYRHSMLQLSWLGGEFDGLGRGHSVMLHPEGINMSWIEGVRELLPSGDLRGKAQGIVERVAAAIGEIGYDPFVDDITSGEMAGGPDSPVGTDVINVIPSGGKKAQCADVLLVAARGDGKRGAGGFSQCMQQMKTHLIECAGITRFVLFITDTWDAQGFIDNHFNELRAHYGRGVRFVFLIVGSPRHHLSPITVDFGPAGRRAGGGLRP
jgi:hypothetical protein